MYFLFFVFILASALCEEYCVPFPFNSTGTLTPTTQLGAYETVQFNSTTNVTCITAHFPYSTGFQVIHGSRDISQAETPYFVEIKKENDDSWLKVTVSAGFKCLGDGLSCRYEILINGMSCKPRIIHEIFQKPATDIQWRDTFVGYCQETEFGGGRQLTKGIYNVSMVYYPMEQLHGNKWENPKGSLPHGVIPFADEPQTILGEEDLPQLIRVSEIAHSDIQVFFNSTMSLATSGVVREFEFVKEHGSTNLRITWYDFFRCHFNVIYANLVHQPSTNSPDQCDWEILIDGEPCEPGEIHATLKTPHETDYGSGKTIYGLCEDVSAGTHTITVRIGGTATAMQTGGFGTTGLIAIEEVSDQQQIRVFSAQQSCTARIRGGLPMICFPTLEPDHDCVFACRQWTFVKPASVSVDAGIAITYFDDYVCSNREQGNPCYRAYNGHDNCRHADCMTLNIEILIDGYSCIDPGPMKFDISGDRLRYKIWKTHAYIGICRTIDGPSGERPISVGSHVIDVKNRVMSQNPNDEACRDCDYTCYGGNCLIGFNPRIPVVGSFSYGFMEVEFLEPVEETVCSVN